ncbi:MAG: hypothetical protein AAF447_26730, partial [Myxococcota bacterium]
MSRRSLALESAEQAAARLGPAAGLRVLRALKGQLPPEDRARAATRLVALSLALGRGADAAAR